MYVFEFSNGKIVIVSSNQRLKPTADLLSQIAKEQGESVDRIVELVKRNGQQLQRIKVSY